MVTDRTTPLVLWRHAKEFADAARAVRIANDDRISLPTCYLLGHSIELSLKAFLLARGIPLNILKSRKYGHDLSTLVREARQRRLGLEVKLEAVDIGVIQLLNFEYVAKKYEYRESGTYHIPDASLAQNIADRLVTGLKKYSNKSTVAKIHILLQT